MELLVLRAVRAIWLGLSATGLGVSLLIVSAWVVYLNHPGVSLVDGYWMGPVPWTPAGIVLILGGSALALAASGAAIMVGGDWLRRFLLVVIAVLPVVWWLTALGAVSFGRFRGPHPVELAYSLPVTAAVALIVPAIAASFLAIEPLRHDRRVRLRRVHPEGRITTPGED